jgi:hypothetical protein
MIILLAGMWILGVDCVVNILNSTPPTVAVLMEEFDAGEGQRIFVQVLTGENMNNMPYQ